MSDTKTLTKKQIITEAVLQQLPPNNEPIDRIINEWWFTRSGDGLRLSAHGDLCFKLAEIEFFDLPFAPKRVFTVTNVPKNEIRGQHAHYETEQIFICTNGSILVGLDDGKTKEEVIETLHDLRSVNVDVVTIGQYLQPSKKHLPVKQFITPDEFAEYESVAKNLGFRHVESSALVRSSYHAQKHIL